VSVHESFLNGFEDDRIFQAELDNRITKHLEAWPDWSRMTEEEQDEVYQEIYEIALFAWNKARE